VSEGHAGPPAFVSGLRAVSRGPLPGRRPGAGFLRPMRPYFRQVAGLLVIGSLAGIVMNTAVVLPSVLLGHAIDTVLAYRRGQAPGSAVTMAALLLIGGSAATELPRVGKRWWLGVARTRIYASVRADALRGVLSWPADQLHSMSVGEVMARIIGDVEVLGIGAGEVITETWDTLLFSVSLAVAMFVYDPALGALALVPVPLALALAKLAGARVSRRTLRARQANAALTAFVQEGPRRGPGPACFRAARRVDRPDEPAGHRPGRRGTGRDPPGLSAGSPLRHLDHRRDRRRDLAGRDPGRRRHAQHR